MANIIPISELASNASRISKLCHTNGDPVFLTKDGYGDMVVLSMKQYELINTQAQAYRENEKKEAAKACEPIKADEPEDEAEGTEETDPKRLIKTGIEKLPLEDVVDILKKVLDRQTADPQSRKRFP